MCVVLCLCVVHSSSLFVYLHCSDCLCNQWIPFSGDPVAGGNNKSDGRPNLDTIYCVCSYAGAYKHTHTHTDNHAYSSYCTIDTKTGKGNSLGTVVAPENLNTLLSKGFFYSYFLTSGPLSQFPQSVSPLAL